MWEDQTERALSRKPDSGEQSRKFLESKRNCPGKKQIGRSSVQRERKEIITLRIQMTAVKKVLKPPRAAGKKERSCSMKTQRARRPHLFSDL